MDMSFATQALSAEWALKASKKKALAVRVHDVPKEVEEPGRCRSSWKVWASRSTASRPTRSTYLSSWAEGTE